MFAISNILLIFAYINKQKMENLKKQRVIRTERGWAGHFCLADSCQFKRNTLLSYKDINIVVSTVGNLVINGKLKTLGGDDRYYETMAFHSDVNDKRFHDIDVSREISFDCDSAILKLNADDEANKMHEDVVFEITTKLEHGYRFENYI